MSFTTTWQITRPAAGPSTSLHLRTIRKLNFDYWRVGAWLGEYPGRRQVVSLGIIPDSKLTQRQNCCKWQVGDPPIPSVSLCSFGDIRAVYVIKHNIRLSLYLIEFRRLNSSNLDLSSIFRYK